MMRLMLPLMVKTMNLEKTMGTEQRYTIDFNAPAQESSKTLA
jgi:hypothetical protein